MNDAITPENYEKAKRDAKEFYLTIGNVWCPAFKEHITFNSDGFRHLIWRNELPRPKKEQLYRFTLLPFAIKILENAKTCQEYRHIETDSADLKPNVQFWAILGKNQKTSIKIIIRQLGHGRKHFFSIFETKKQKPALL